MKNGRKLGELGNDFGLYNIELKATGWCPRIFSATFLLFNTIVAFEIPLETSGQRRTRENRYSRQDGLKHEDGFCIYDR